jgi:hypothetical protein
MPRLIKLYIVNVAIGYALSALFLGLLIAFDVAGLRPLILDTPSGWLAGLIFFISNGVVFAGVQFAFAVMSLAERDGGPRGGLRLPALMPRKLERVKVEARAARRTRD